MEPRFKNISMIGTSDRGKCALKMSNAPLNAALLKNAFEVVQDTKEAIICLTDEWVSFNHHLLAQTVSLICIFPFIRISVGLLQ